MTGETNLGRDACICCDPSTCHNMGSSDQIEFDALVRNIKSESEKGGENITASL